GRVVRCPGLAGGGAAEADGADCLAGAAVHDIAHDVRDEIGDARIEDSAPARPTLPDDAPVAVFDANDQPWRGEAAEGGEGRVRCGHVEEADLGGAECEGGDAGKPAAE